MVSLNVRLEAILSERGSVEQPTTPVWSTPVLGNSSGTVQLQRPVAMNIPESSKLQNTMQQVTWFIGRASPAPVWCYPIAASLGPQVRKSFVEQLYREDSLMVADGTWMPPQGDSLQLATFRKTLSRTSKYADASG